MCKIKYFLVGLCNVYWDVLNDRHEISDRPYLRILGFILIVNRKNSNKQAKLDCVVHYFRAMI